VTRGARPPLIAVCGASEPTADQAAAAEEVGRRLAEAGVVVLCGGLGGVMAAAARGARAGGGLSIGLLPGEDADAAAPDIDVAIPTGLGEIRNALLARACTAMIAIGGGYGTLSEVALALRLGRPVAALDSWEVRRPGTAEADPEIHVVASAAEAAAWAVQRALTLNQTR